MTVVWIGTFAFLIIALIRRHGWEYVPLVILIGLGRWYVSASGLAVGSLADIVTLILIAGVWVISGWTRD